MRHIFIFLLILLTFAFSSAKKDPVSRQLEDFSVFKNVLTEKEGRLDLHTTADSMYYYLSQLEEKLSHELSLLDQYKYYCETVAKIQCGHTQLHPSRQILGEWLRTEQSLPLDFIMHGKRLYVNKILSEDLALIGEGKSAEERKKKIRPYSEILTLDHKTVHEMMLEISPYISSDENALDFKYYQVSYFFDFYRHISSPFEKDSIHVSYVEGDDTLELYFQTGKAPINTIRKRFKTSGDEYELQQQSMGKFEIVRSNYAVFRFSSFTNGSGKAFEEFLKTSFTRIQSKGIDKVIVDLRGNTGGVMQYSLMRYFVGEDVFLGRYVVEKPKKGIEDKHLKKMSGEYRKHKRLSRNQGRKVRNGKFENGDIRTEAVDEDLVFKGQIVVITDEGTFSSASMLACHLKTMCNAKIIGRTAGGSFYRGNAGTLTAVLPNSAFKLLVNPNTFYSHLPEAKDPREIKQPDVVLHPEYLKKRKIDDYYLKAAIDSFN